MTKRLSALHPGYALPPDTGKPQVNEFGHQVAENFPVPPLLGEILYHRGFTTLHEVRDFLYPQLATLPAPETMKGMQQAVRCILETCRANGPIFIHGDYDVDGITATALLKSFFREIGIETVAYIPNRLEEGYGMSIASINRLLAQADQVRGGLLISVDCGITAVDEVVHAQKLGLRIIITDHHEPKNVLPAADAILNPQQPGCTFPFPLLAGVGVAFFLIIALRKAFVESGVVALSSMPNLKKYLDLVALGTVADVVPLIGINRILVHAGLEVLSAKSRIGVFCLCECCGIAGRQVLAEDIAFKLAPRINASGRLGCPQVGLALLSTGSREEAMQAAQALETMNGQRKELELSMYSVIDEQCNLQVLEGLSGLTVYQEDCHPGVVGILASKNVDRYHRPVIIFTDDFKGGSGEYLKGSGRSVAGVDLLHILQQCAAWIEQFGGHAMAVGLTIKRSNLEAFRQSFHGQASQHDEVIRKSSMMQRIDHQFHDKEALTGEFVQALQLMQPFGEGNPEPKFLLANELVLHPKDIKGHLAFQVRVNGYFFPGIGFNLADSTRNFQEPVDVVFQLKRSWFKGVGRDQIQVLHLVPC